MNDEEPTLNIRVKTMDSSEYTFALRSTASVTDLKGLIEQVRLSSLSG